jgi:hypothetical protein
VTAGTRSFGAVQGLHIMHEHPQEMFMHIRLSAAAVALATTALLSSFPAQASAQRGTFSSRSHGPTFGVSLAAVALNTEGGRNDNTEFGGAGVHMEVGWHMMSSHFGVLLDYASVNIDDEGPPNIRRYNHIGGVGRYLFRSDRDIVRPYLEIGVNRREVTARTAGLLPRSARTRSVGGAIGGGMQVFLARAVALDLSAQLGLGGFDDWKSGDDEISSLPEVKQATGVLRLGVRFWPGY